LTLLPVATYTHERIGAALAQSLDKRPQEPIMAKKAKKTAKKPAKKKGK
jgi:hypothetical protein